ncbi:AzlD domain-containing protein [uncultured Sharpea sp.]|uniref:AzlD domain-containing protein n=1 Tax=uncultured Sharpea sp. TaxID=1112738 RepID=UPI00258EF1B2|nr:AzlD domain-containing protein [uncultured Sharpea sp.]
MNKIIVIIILCALLTFILRATPYFLVNKIEHMPDYLEKLIADVLVVYCFKDAFFTTPLKSLPALIAGLVTAISYKLHHNTTLSIILGTILYMGILHIL